MIESTIDFLPAAAAAAAAGGAPMDVVSVAVAVGVVVVPRAFVDAGAGLGSGRAGIFPASALGTSLALAGVDSGILYLYFAEEFQSRQSNLFFGQ